MTSLVRVAVVLVPLLLATNGCTISNGVAGSGISTTEERAVGPFDSVSLSGAGRIQLRQATEPYLAVTADDNLIEYIETTIENGTLKIRMTEPLNPRTDIVFDITTDSIRNVSCSGTGTIVLEEIRGDSLSIDASGAASFAGDGEVTNLNISISGAASVKLRDLNAEHTKVKMSGAGSVAAVANQSLDASVSGVGSITCYGNPTSIKKRISGMGRIRLIESTTAD